MPGLLVALLGCAASLAAGSSPTAQASTWAVAHLPDAEVRAAFYGVSCASPKLCVAVGGNNTIASSADPTGGAAAWRVARPIGSFVEPKAQTSAAAYGGGQIRGVSCPTERLCFAASFEGDIYSSSDPTGPASAWKVVPLSAPNEPNVHMGGISCPTTAFCVAVAYGGKVVTSSRPGGERADWTLTQLAIPYDLRGVSCASPSLCVAVDNEGTVSRFELRLFGGKRGLIENSLNLCGKAFGKATSSSVPRTASPRASITRSKPAARRKSSPAPIAR